MVAIGLCFSVDVPPSGFGPMACAVRHTRAAVYGRPQATKGLSDADRLLISVQGRFPPLTDLIQRNDPDAFTVFPLGHRSFRGPFQ